MTDSLVVNRRGDLAGYGNKIFLKDLYGSIKSLINDPREIVDGDLVWMY